MLGVMRGRKEIVFNLLLVVFPKEIAVQPLNKGDGFPGKALTYT